MPLACCVEFMGFKALVIARPPAALDDTSIAYGPSSVDGSYKSSGKLDRELVALGKTLAIKPHNFVWNEAEM